jgi:putative transposase
MIKKERFCYANHCVYNLGYHLIWCTKYRKKILDYKLRDLFIEKAEKIGVFIEVMEIMPDHVHLFVKTNQNNSPSFIVKELKGYSSHNLRKEFPYLKSLKSLWTHSYYCESVGCISENTIKRYIENQKN